MSEHNLYPMCKISSDLENESMASTQLGRRNDEVHAIANDTWASWDQQLTIYLEAEVSTELDTYLNENPIPRSSEFDILKWWMGNSYKYPILARMARDVLAIPASAVASEQKVLLNLAAWRQSMM